MSIARHWLMKSRTHKVSDVNTELNALKFLLGKGLTCFELP